MTVTPDPASLRTPAGQVVLLELRETLIKSSAALAEARRGPVDVRALVTARREHVSAMTAYAQALQAMRLPVPRQLRDDLRLQTRVVATSDGSAAYPARSLR